MTYNAIYLKNQVVYIAQKIKLLLKETLKIQSFLSNTIVCLIKER